MEPIQAILDQKGREIHVVARDATVLDAVGTMCRAHVGAVLVMEGDRLCGIFSERDLMSRVVLAGKEPSTTPVAEVMTTEVTSIAPDVSAHDAMALMTDRRVRHLPVAEGRRIVGLVSIGDLVRWTLHDREAEIANLQDYVSGRYPG
jgi:CBS domain-containing protein